MFNINNQRKEYLAGLVGMGGGPASLVVSGPTGATAVDFFGSPSNYMDQYTFRGAYDSDSNFYCSAYSFTPDTSWSTVKIKPDGTQDWAKKFTSHSAGTFKDFDIGYNDILIGVGYTSGSGLYLWGVDKTGALLWNKNYKLDDSTYTTLGDTLYFSGAWNLSSTNIRAMTTADVAIICIGYDNIDSNGNNGPGLLFLTIKITDGTKIGWMRQYDYNYGNINPDSGFAAYLPSGSTTGYWILSSKIGTGSALTNAHLYKNFNYWGTFYTANHSGTKDPTGQYGTALLATGFSNSYPQMTIQNIYINDMDCLKDATGSNPWANTVVVGYRKWQQTTTYGSDTKPAMIFDKNLSQYSWSSISSFEQIQTSGNRNNEPRCVAVKDSDTYFIGGYVLPEAWTIPSDDRGVYLARVDTSSGTSTISWIVRFRVQESTGTYGGYTPAPRKLYVDTNGDKGMLCIGVYGYMLIAQFDTGSTSPATGTYNLTANTPSGTPIAKVIVDDISSSALLSTISSAVTSGGVGWTPFSWTSSTFDTQTWSTQSLSNSSLSYNSVSWP